MKKVSKIIIKKTENSIPEKFDLDISDLTVITGENNSGKTNFIKEVKDKNAIFYDEKGNDITEYIDPVYIPAEYIIGDTQFKVGKTSDVVKILKDLISGNPSFKLKKDSKNHVNNLDSIVDSVNKKIGDIFTDEKHKNQTIKISIDSEVALKDILDTVLKIIPLDYATGIEHEKFDELGQGWQRLIIAIFQLTVSETNVDDKRIRLILFEEPEAYLHPKLKRALNGMLKGIASRENNQVIITTHDPYFAITNLEDGKNSVYSFIRNDGKTEKSKPNVISGVEDELLHVLIFNKALGISGQSLEKFTQYLLKKDKKTPLVKYFNHKNKESMLALPIYIRHLIHHPENKHTISGKNRKFTEDEIALSIKILNNVL